MQTPEIIRQLDSGLNDLVTADDTAGLSVEAVARYLGIDKTALRKMMYTGTVPFGFGREGDKYSRGSLYISKLVFYNWAMQRKQ